MSRDRAICPFATSTLKLKRAYAVSGHKHAADDSLVLHGKAASDKFQIIHGPPIGTRSLDSDEFGPRFIGDKHCWIIPRDLPGELHS
jgi:hypothetical protein